MRLYSKHLPNTERLRVVHMAARGAVRSQPVGSPASRRRWTRLAPDVAQRLAADYRIGVPTTALARRYGLGKGTVLRLLRECGVVMRRPGVKTQS